MLSSPIILPDYPEIAPESPGDLFDAAEIDQLLTPEHPQPHRRGEAARCARPIPRTREILERTESLSQEELMRLHGAIREFGMAPGWRADELLGAARAPGAGRGHGRRRRAAPPQPRAPAAAARARTCSTSRWPARPRSSRRSSRAWRATCSSRSRSRTTPAATSARSARSATASSSRRRRSSRSTARDARGRRGSASSSPASATSSSATTGSASRSRAGSRAATLPAGVVVEDFGIRGMDLAYALQDYDVAIFVDALPRGDAPGTLYLIEPELDDERGRARRPRHGPGQGARAGAAARATRCRACWSSAASRRTVLTLEDDAVGGAERAGARRARRGGADGRVAARRSHVRSGTERKEQVT